MVSINRVQHLVLQWLSTGEGDSPSIGWKASARALENRKLVSISRNNGTYAATITEKGAKFLLEHPVPPAEKPSLRPKQSQPQTTDNTQLKQVKATVPKRSSRKRHPAVKSLSKHRGALPRDRDAQQRAIEAADALIDAALDAGFQLEGHEQPIKSPITNSSPFTGCPLVTIKTEHVELTITIGEQLKQVPHELTAEEKAKNERSSWSWAPSHDYVRTGKTFFRIKGTYSPKKFLETDRKPLAQYVPNLIAYIQRQEEEAREHAQRAAREAAERAEREAQARILEGRRKEYDVWEKALTTKFKDWDRLQRLRRFIDELEASTPSVTAAQFIAWARDHVDALDPVSNFQLPTTELPDLSHQERAHYGEYKEPTYRYGYKFW